jgi:cephalosporin hydroxylase
MNVSQLSGEQDIEGYHRWYYETAVWDRTTFMGVPCLKSVSDMWNYQEILFERKPSLVVEFGTFYGGSALFFSFILRAISMHSKVITVDRTPDRIYPEVRNNSQIEILTCETTHPIVAKRIVELRCEYPGGVFVILDSDHSKRHVISEMIMLRLLLTQGDYVIVEDGNLNGHPVCPEFGEGPFEAITEYLQRYPADYRQDRDREQKFGFTFAPRGFLIRN